MGLIDTVKGWVNQDSAKYLYHRFEPDRVRGGESDVEPVRANVDYFRVWLAEMYLSKSKAWFQDWYPAVHSSVRFQFGTETVEIPNIAGELRLKDVKAANLARVVSLNYPMTTLMPFNGGTVELSAGLLAVQGQNQVGRFIDVLGEFAGLLAVPQLSAALKVAVPVASGIQELLRAANGGLHVGLHQGFTGTSGPTQLRAGYQVVVLAERDEVGPEDLWVEGGRLHGGDAAGPSAPFSGKDYMLFWIERVTERDDWESFANVKEPFNEALDALAEDEPERAQSLLRTALVIARKSPDFTRADRTRIARTLKEEFDRAGEEGLAAVRPEREADLGDLMRRGISAEQAAELSEPSLEELFGE
jgi:hypothetical protein